MKSDNNNMILPCTSYKQDLKALIQGNLPNENQSVFGGPMEMLTQQLIDHLDDRSESAEVRIQRRQQMADLTGAIMVAMLDAVLTRQLGWWLQVSRCTCRNRRSMCGQRPSLSTSNTIFCTPSPARRCSCRLRFYGSSACSWR